MASTGPARCRRRLSWAGIPKANGRRSGAHAAGIRVALLPFSAISFGYAIARSVYLAETRGVRWRGTTYPLSLLRGQSGLEGIAANRSR